MKCEKINLKVVNIDKKYAKVVFPEIFKNESSGSTEKAFAVFNEIGNFNNAFLSKEYWLEMWETAIGNIAVLGHGDLEDSSDLQIVMC